MSEKMPNMDYDADEVINEFKEKIKWPKKNEVEAVVAPAKVPLRILIAFLITIIGGAILYYIMLPAINFKDSQMYIYLIALVALFVFGFYIACKANKMVERREYVKKKSFVPLIIIGVIVVVMAVGYVAGATLFRAHSYSQLMSVEESDFSTDFSEISYDEVPRLDRLTANYLADQQLGKLDEYKSQYVVTDNSTQINYKGTPVRVAYLEYASILKWWNNTKNGLPAYMIVDLVSQKVQVVNCVEQFGEGIKYSPTELFNEKLIRHIRFQYPTFLLDTPNFEIDDNAHPYWITPVLDHTIGLFGGIDVKGAVITDALTGESNYYDIETIRSDSSLNWIDVVYSESLIISQYNYYGKLQNGFWNSIFFQNDVNVASSGSGNIALDDDVWVYTGVTSIEADSSNFGFILCNQRTKETRYYKNGGATEYSAVKSAEDTVQNYEYSATFPILLDIEGQPTYFMSFYGDGYTIRGFALVNLEDKTIVGRGVYDEEKSMANALNAAVENYINALKDEGLVDSDANADDYMVDEDSVSDTDSANQSQTLAVTGEVTDIKSSVNNGNTVYYLQIDGVYYYISVVDSMEVLLINTGDTVTVEYDSASGSFIPAKSVKLG